MSLAEDISAPSRAEFAERIKSLWHRSREQILALGRALIDAKAALPHGEFTAMIEADLPFGPQVARKFMRISEDLGQERLTSNVLPHSADALDAIRKIPSESFEKAVMSGEISPSITVKQARTLAKRLAPEDTEDTEDTTSNRHGGKISIPNGHTVEQVVRDGMKLEMAEGISPEAASRRVRIGVQSYRKARDIIALSERDNLSRKDTAAVKRALKDLNDSSQIGAAYESIRPIVTRVWGEEPKGPRDALAASRLEAFERALATIKQVCSSAAEIDIPYISEARVASAEEELKEAEKSLKDLRTKIGRIYQ